MLAATLADDLKLYNSIFLEEADLYRWDKHRDYILRQSLVEPELAVVWAQSLHTLEVELGRKFLVPGKHVHPLAQWVMRIDRTGAIRLAQIAYLVRYLKATDPHYERFRQRLQSPKWARQETMALMIMGHLIRVAGLDMVTIPEATGRQTPDFAMTDPESGQAIHGELSQLAPADDLAGPANDYEEINTIIDTTLKNPLFSANLLSRIPPGYSEQLPAILRVLEAYVDDTREGTTYTDDHLTITQFPIDQMTEFNSWMDKYDRRKGFHGIPQDYDDTERIAGNKIPDKGVQTSVNGAGILCIPVPWTHFWHQQVTHTVARITARMAGFPQMLGTFLFSEIIHFDAQNFRFHADDAFLRRTLANGLTLYSLFVTNPAYAGSANGAIYKKVIQALNAPDAPLEQWRL